MSKITHRSTVHVDLDELSEVLHRGIIRASKFSSLGYCMADRATADDLHVSEEVAIHISLTDTPPNFLDDIRANFKAWVMLNGLRELVETFGLFMQSLYNACCVIVHHRNIKRVRKLAEEFGRLGEPKRLRRLISEFGIRTSLDAELYSMFEARNCITHRWGICQDKPLTIRWISPEFSIVEADGRTRIISLPMREKIGPIIDGRGYIEWKRVSKMYDVGQLIAITPRELHEMCATVDRAALELRQLVAKLGERHPAVPIKNDHPPSLDVVATYLSPPGR